MMYQSKFQYVPLIALGLLLFIGSASASAGPVSDIPDALNDALFGGSNLFAAQAVLTAAIMMSAGLFLAMMKLNMIATFIVLFCVLGGLTAIGWADPTLMLVAAMIAAGLFVKRITDYMTGHEGAADEE
jgi:hypothetical protein